MRKKIVIERQEKNKNSNLFRLLGELIVNVVALLVVETIVPGVELSDLKTAFIAAIVIGVVNTFIRPILQLIALPISLLTLGLTAFLINVGLLLLVSKIVPGFEISSFLVACFASIVLSLVTSFLHKIARD